MNLSAPRLHIYSFTSSFYPKRFTTQAVNNLSISENTAVTRVPQNPELGSFKINSAAKEPFKCEIIYKKKKKNLITEKQIYFMT